MTMHDAQPVASPPKRRRGRPSPDETRLLETALLSAATRLMCEKGYSATSMDEIALAAGVGKKALYARFRNKEALFSAVVDHVYPDRGSWNIEGIGEADLHLSFEEGLIRRARLILIASSQPQAVALYRLVQHEALRFPEIAAVFDRYTSEVISGLTRYFATEKERGRLADIDPATAAVMFMLAVTSDAANRTIYQHPMPDNDEIELYSGNMARLFARGLARSDAPATFAPFGHRFRFTSGVTD